MFKLFLISFFTFVFGLSIFSQKKVDLEKMRKSKMLEMKGVEDQILKTQSDKKSTFVYIALLERKIGLRKEIIESLSDEIDVIDSKISYLSADIVELDKEVTSLKLEYSKLVLASYFQKRNYNTFSFLLASNNFNQAYRRFYFFREYSTHRKYVLLNLKIQTQKIGASITEFKSIKTEKIDLLAKREVEKKLIESDRIVQQNYVGKLSQKEKKLHNNLATLQQVTEKLEAEIQKIIKEEALAATKKSKKLIQLDRNLSKNFAGNKGRLPWPIEEGTVVSLFGEHPHPLFKGIIVKNNGIDLNTPCNSAVSCVFDGVVSKIFAIRGANVAIIVRHGEFLTVYQNITSVSVKVGETVSTKTLVGYAACSADEKLATFHFEIWHELNKLDPKLWLYKK